MVDESGRDASIEDLLALEHAGWAALCDGSSGEFYGALMTDECRMVLAGGFVMDRDQVVQSLSSGPQWDTYEIHEPIAAALSPVGAPLVIALLYRGVARRGDTVFSAVMTSTYARIDDRWRLVWYQQTPVGAD